MAIQAYAQVSGMNQEMYDGMIQQAGEKRTSSPGFIVHFVSPVEGGMGVTEIWESREAMDAFLANVVIAMMQSAGMPPIEPQVRPIHNLITSGK